MKSNLSALFLILFLLMRSVTVSATKYSDPPNTAPEVVNSIAVERPENAFLFDRFQLLAKLESIPQMEAAYIDAWAVLKANDSCGNFFGRPETSLYVLNDLMSQLKNVNFSNRRLGIRMSGTVTIFQDNRLQVTFRKFKTASINYWGAFYQSTDYTTNKALSRVGSFQPNTREARALMLLHELAHMIKGADGKYLIPDDGNNENLSRNNTNTIAKRCAEQISRLKNLSTRLTLKTHLEALSYGKSTSP